MIQTKFKSIARKMLKSKKKEIKIIQIQNNISLLLVTKQLSDNKNLLTVYPIFKINNKWFDVNFALKIKLDIYKLKKIKNFEFMKELPLCDIPLYDWSNPKNNIKIENEIKLYEESFLFRYLFIGLK